MRDAARATRQETTDRMRAEATARIDAIRTTAATQAIELRKRADDDAVGIREWSKAEIARIREEAEKRVVARRAELAREAASHSGEVERLVEQVKSVATTFEAEMDQFFEVLLAEQDPARLATLAEQVPDAPVFAGLPPIRRGHANGTGRPKAAGRRLAPRKPRSAPVKRAAASGRAGADMLQARLAPDAAAAAEAEAIADLDSNDDPDADWTPGSLATVLAAAPKIDSPDDLSAEEIVGLLGIDTESTDDLAEVEEVAPVGDGPEMETIEPEVPVVEEETRVVVTGLTSVAGISAFKGALGRVPGVASVSVSSGADDDFIFTAVHASTADLRRAIPEFARFGAQMTLDEGTVVSFVVSEPG